jgi:hypothetical protein
MPAHVSGQSGVLDGESSPLLDSGEFYFGALILNHISEATYETQSMITTTMCMASRERFWNARYFENWTLG